MDYQHLQEELRSETAKFKARAEKDFPFAAEQANFILNRLQKPYQETNLYTHTVLYSAYIVYLAVQHTDYGGTDSHVELAPMFAFTDPMDYIQYRIWKETDMWGDDGFPDLIEMFEIIVKDLNLGGEDDLFSDMKIRERSKARWDKSVGYCLESQIQTALETHFPAEWQAVFAKNPEYFWENAPAEKMRNFVSLIEFGWARTNQRKESDK